MTISSLPTQVPAPLVSTRLARQRQAKRRRDEVPPREKAAAAPAPKRTCTVLNRDGFDVKMEILDPAKMSSEERCVLRERLRSEVATVRDILKKTELLAAASSSSAAPRGKNGWSSAAASSSSAAPRGKNGRSLAAASSSSASPRGKNGRSSAAASSSSAAPRGKNGRSLAAKRRSEALDVAVGLGDVEADRADYKRRETSPLVEYIELSMLPETRERLAGRLSSLAAELPVSILQFLQQHCSDNPDPNGDIEVDIHHVRACTMFKLLGQMEEFMKERNQGRQAKPESSEKAGLNVTGASRSSTHLREDGKLVKEEEEEEEEEVDICGDASPVLLEKNVLITSSRYSSPSSSSEDSDSDSDSESSSSVSDMDSGSESESDERAVNPPGLVGSGNVGADVSTVCHSSPTHLRKDGELVGEEEEYVDICGTSPTLAENDAVIRSNRPDVAVARTHFGQQQKEQKARAADVKLKGEHAKVTRLNLERAKARQVLLEMERSAQSSGVIHPSDLRRLGIAAIEHFVSSEDDMSLKHSPDSPFCLVQRSRCPLQQLGLFMKAQEGGVEEEEWPRSIRVTELEEGEII